MNIRPPPPPPPTNYRSGGATDNNGKSEGIWKFCRPKSLKMRLKLQMATCISATKALYNTRM